MLRFATFVAFISLRGLAEDQTLIPAAVRCHRFKTPEGKSSAEEILTLPSDGNVDVHEGLVTMFTNLFKE